MDAAELIDRGCSLSEAGEHVEAAWCFQRAVELGETWAAFNLGNELVQLERPLAAIPEYERALAVGETDAWLNLGAVLEGLGDLAGALRAYEQGRLAGDAQAGIQRAYLLRETGERASAAVVMGDVARTGSALADAIAACWEWDTSLDPALEPRLRAGAELHPDARVDLAHLLRDTAREDEAVALLRWGAEAGENECLLPLGNLLYDHAGLVDDAEAAYRAGIAAGDTYCHHNLACLLEDEDRLVEALHHYRLGAAAGDALAQRALDALAAEDRD